jgi:hypothetical protein
MAVKNAVVKTRRGEHVDRPAAIELWLFTEKLNIGEIPRYKAFALPDSVICPGHGAFQRRHGAGGAKFSKGSWR